MDTDPYAVARQLFGSCLRHVRTQAGMSLRELGRRCNYDYTRLSRLERGEHLADEDLISRIDRVLATGGLLAVLRAAAQPPRRPAVAAPAPIPAMMMGSGTELVTLEIRLPDGRTVRMSISRRDFGQLLAGGALSAALPAGVLNTDEADRLGRAIASPRRTDLQVIGYFRRLLTEHYTADKMLGPRQMLPPVLAQLAVLDRLRREARPPVARPLLETLCQYGEFAGWLHQDAGDLNAAMFWSDRATQWAQSAGDYQMVSYLLVRKSNIACLADDPATVVELARAARGVPGGIDPKITALATQQEARGWAQIQDASRCARSLDTAAEFLRAHPQAGSPEVPVYIHHYDLGTLEEQSASCYRSLGHAEKAIAILERKIATLPPSLHRDRGHQMSKLANAITAARQPDPQRAAQLGLASLELARQTGSARITRELWALERTLGIRWPDQPDTRALHEALTGI